MTAPAGRLGDLALVSGRADGGRRAIGGSALAAAQGLVTADRAGTSVVTQSSSVPVSPAVPVGETGQRGREVTQRRVGDPAIDMGGDRERRVHQHDGRTHGGVEVVVYMGSVIAGDGDAWEQTLEQVRAGVGELVQD